MGVARYLGTDIEERIANPGKPWSLLPRALLPFRDRPGNPKSPIAPPFPDLVIASGRRTLPYLQAIRKAAGDKVKTVYLKDPQIGTSVADLIWVPEHDSLRGENVIVTLTSPHTLTDKLLQSERISAAERFSQYPGKRIGLILGGNTKGVKWEEQTCDRFAAALAKIPDDGHSILAISSRRTPPQLEDCVRTALRGRNIFYWNSEDDSPNPYRQVLALADILIVTGDSHNMVSEALATGAPVYTFRPFGLKQKLHQFLDDLQERKLAQNFEGLVAEFPTSPIDATREIANAIQQRMLGAEKA